MDGGVRSKVAVVVFAPSVEDAPEVNLASVLGGDAALFSGRNGPDAGLACDRSGSNRAGTCGASGFGLGSSGPEGPGNGATS